MGGELLQPLVGPRPIENTPEALSAWARGVLIQSLENGDLCNPQTRDGRLLETTDARIQAFLDEVNDSG